MVVVDEEDEMTLIHVAAQKQGYIPIWRRKNVVAPKRM